jgi:RNA polymerase sigma-70 factor (ECF subfamily)
MRTTPFAPLRALFGLTDEQAMWRVQMHGDEQAFAQLVRRWEAPIRRLCTRMTGDFHQAEDLAQETFTRLYTRRAAYPAATKFSTWLWRVALNICYDELRRRARRRTVSLEGDRAEAPGLLDELVAPETAPDHALADQERGELVRQALLRLPETYRSVLVLRHYEGLKFREIAEVLEVPEGTVKSRMAEALTQLQRRLETVLRRDSTAPTQPRNRIDESVLL